MLMPHHGLFSNEISLNTVDSNLARLISLEGRGGGVISFEVTGSNFARVISLEVER